MNKALIAAIKFNLDRFEKKICEKSKIIIVHISGHFLRRVKLKCKISFFRETFNFFWLKKIK